MNEKLRAIVAAAGECWHNMRAKVFPKYEPESSCEYCGLRSCTDPNPLPTDLNELFRLYEKVTHLDLKLARGINGYWCYLFSDSFTCEINVFERTPSEALLNALYEAVKEDV